MPLNLPEPKNLRKVADEPFSVEASLVHRLGTESVSDKVLSVIELIKNSYDADATDIRVILKNIRTGTPEIIVEDDGSGMTLDDIRQGWLRIATSRKSRKSISPQYKRRVLGQKGIGRFSTENLSAYTEITTYPKDQKLGFSVGFDWKKFHDAQELSEVLNAIKSFEKPPNVQGTRILLQKLHHAWTEEDVQRLWTFIRSLTPPAVTAPNFKVTVETDEFEELSGPVESGFLEKSVYVFEARLSKTGRVKYIFRQFGVDKVIEKEDKRESFRCGPVFFKMNFFYREKGKLQSFGIDIDDIESIKRVLDNYCGIKVYRDTMRISGFGNPDDDWVGLDKLSRDDPSIIPATHQVIAAVNITSEFNPEINDTVARENIIKNDSFKDLVSFILDAISVFSQIRGELEHKRQPGPKNPSRYVKKARDNLKKNKNRKPLLDFPEWPMTFFRNLEEEINTCYFSSLPNATLVLSRKLIENLLYKVLEEKFPSEVALRFNQGTGKIHNFSVLVGHLRNRKGDFNMEQRIVIDKFLEFVDRFRDDANQATHRLLEYKESIDELEELRITELVQLELQLIKLVRTN
jgi:hypothetical protein